MPFIGIVAKESDSNFIKNEVLKNATKNKFDIINIKKENIQNIKNIKFETIVINDDLTEFLKYSTYLEELINKAKYVIINSDIIKNTTLFGKDENINLITYGLNRDATVTMSSMKNESLLLCIQKQIKNVKGQIIEEQEWSVEIVKNNLKKICNSMAIFTILVIYGEILKKI
jgi:hypothetical protein